MSFVIPKEGIWKNANKKELNKTSVEYLKNLFIMGKVRKRLGSNIEQELKKLRKKQKSNTLTKLKTTYYRITVLHYPIFIGWLVNEGILNA